jgi:hypothetical protein
VRGLRWLVLLALAAAPLAFGSVHPFAYLPLLALGWTSGIAALRQARLRRERGEQVPAVPGGRLLVALHVLVVVQLVPLPKALLRILSPGTARTLDAATQWHAVSVNPQATLGGLLFLGGVTSLYVFVLREMADSAWRRRVQGLVALEGVVLAVLGFAQSAYWGTTIYGIWKPAYDWAVYGPYVNRNHFAGYLVMAIPVAVAFAALSMRQAARRWRERRVGWLSLFDPEAGHAARQLSAAGVMVISLLATGSRGGLLGFGAGSLFLVALLPLRRGAALALGVLGCAAPVLVWTLLDGAFHSTANDFRNSRLVLWTEILRMVPSFPVFGVGLNAFGAAFRPYQLTNRYEWVEQTHNEYLQVLCDLGLVGSVLTAALLVTLVRAAVRHARSDVLGAGVCAALLGECAHNVVDFNWQIPANAVTFAALAALATQAPAAVEHVRSRVPRWDGGSDRHDV